MNNNGCCKTSQKDVRRNCHKTFRVNETRPFRQKDPENTLYTQKVTEHMTAYLSKGWALKMTQISVDKIRQKRVSQAIVKALPDEATGTVTAFVEALKIDAKGAANIICTLWSKCLCMTYTLEHWRTALLVSLYKKRRQCLPVILQAHLTTLLHKKSG